MFPINDNSCFGILLGIFVSFVKGDIAVLCMNGLEEISIRHCLHVGKCNKKSSISKILTDAN